MTVDDIFLEILNKGEYQLSDLEREQMLDNLRKEIAHRIVEISVNATDLRAFPLSTILQAMTECKVRINARQEAKKQALEILKELQKAIPIKRAQMRVRIRLRSSPQIEQMQTVLDACFKGEYEIEKITSEAEAGDYSIQAAADPKLYRGLHELLPKMELSEDG